MTREISSSESDCFVASEITDALSQVKETMLARLERMVDWERLAMRYYEGKRSARHFR